MQGQNVLNIIIILKCDISAKAMVIHDPADNGALLSDLHKLLND